jgi:hypothetical protein
MDNKRKFLRRRLVYRGYALFGTHVQGCSICDASEGGAQIHIKNPADIPDQFVLSLSGRGPPCRKCQVVWRTDDALGVKWESHGDKTACDPDVCPDCPRLRAAEPTSSDDATLWVD